MGIRAIGVNLANKVANPFMKKSTSSNPFEHNSFSGKVFKNSVLPFADVFQTNKVNNKVKLISSSVVSAISNFGHKVAQPVINFANNVKMSIHNTVGALKSIPNKVNEINKHMSEKISKNIDRLKNIGQPEEITENGHKILNINHINEKGSIADLKATWIQEIGNSKVSKEVA